MKVWRTGVAHFNTVGGLDNVERLEVDFETDLPCTHETSAEFQKLAWEAVRRVKPEWAPEGHVRGFVKAGNLMAGSMTMLTHEYKQVS